MAEKTVNHPRWEHGKRTSLSFYAKKLKLKAEQFNHKFFMPLYFEPMIGEKKDVKIADLGAGLFSIIGTLWSNTNVHIHASDLLADEYAQIMKDQGVVPLVPVEKQDMEHLTYEDNFFDIVHCVNALDHCMNPRQAILEMIRVCKPGGWIYLRHYSHVGEHQHYCGLHMWNIDVIDEGVEPNGCDCKIWNKTNVFYLQDLFSGFKTKLGREFSYEPKNMVISMMQKPI